MTELKTCPFCGGKAELKQDMRYPRSGKYAGMSVKAYEVICPNSDCIIYNADNKYFFTREEAAEAWNRRSPDWISVKDRLPDTDTMVIVAIYGSDMITIQESETLLDALNRSKKEFNRITMAFINEGYWCDTDGYPLMVTPSYWMPLPEPPEQKGEPKS